MPTGENAGAGRFNLLRCLGEGGMGVVYEAEDTARGLRVALKTFRRADSETIYRLKREFRALADLSHPNLATLYDLVVEGEKCFFTMELLEGADFLDWVAPGKPRERKTGELAYAATITSASDAPQTLPSKELPSNPLATPPSGTPVPELLSSATHLQRACDERRLRAALPQLGQGLCALHAAGKIHRDIKPSNVRVTAGGRVVLLDFGLVADLGDSGDGVVGTVAYMAPEQAAGERRLGAAADWYAVGVMLYQALTGRLPFEGRPIDVLEAKQRHAPAPPRALAPDTPADLDELCVELLATDPHARPSGAEVLRRLGAADESRVFVSAHASREATLAGREAELAALLACLDLLRAGKAASATVRGPSGIGKSALVGRFLELARARDAHTLVLSGRCYERETVPYRAMDALVDHLSAHLCALPGDAALALLPPDAALLPTLFPVLGRVPAIAGGPPAAALSDQQELRTRAFGALRELLRALARRGPLVLFIDDMQWVDGDTGTLLGSILRAPDPPPLLLLLGTRPEGSEAVVLLAERLAAVHRHVEVGPLSPDAARALVAAQLGDLPADTLERVVAEAGGSPLFLLELARAMQARDPSAVSGDHLAEIAGRGLDAVLGERVELLGAEARAVAEVVAVAAEPIALRTAGLAAGLSGDELRRQLALLRAQRFVRAAGGRADDLVEPYHDRVREALMRLMPGDRRARHHRGIAMALAGQASAERLARHWHGAGEPAKAAEHAWRAAEEAQKTLDFDRAAGFFHMALELGRFDEETRLRLRTALAAALADAGRPREAAREFAAAAAGASATTALELRRRAADALLRGGYVDEGLEATREVLSVFGLSIAPSPRRALSRLLLRRARLRLRGLGWKPRPLSSIPQEELTRVDALEDVAMGLAMVDSFRSGEFCARFVLGALDLGEPQRVGRALALEADLQAALGHGARARRLYKELEALTRTQESPQSVSQLITTGAMIDFFCENRLRRALEKMEEATAMFKAHERRAGFEINIVGLFICWARYYMGELGELARRIPAQVDAAERGGDRFAAVNLRTAFSIVHLVRGAPDECEADVADAIASWASGQDGAAQMQDMFASCARADVALYRGDAAGGLARFRAELPRLEAALLHLLPLNRMLLLCSELRLVLAVAAAAAPGSAERARSVADARRLARRLAKGQNHMARGFVDYVHATCAHLDGDATRARALLDAAVAQLDRDELGLFGQPARLRLGKLIGGVTGAAEIARASAWFSAQGAADPTRLAATLVPGWE